MGKTEKNVTQMSSTPSFLGLERELGIDEGGGDAKVGSHGLRDEVSPTSPTWENDDSTFKHGDLNGFRQ